jgi:adenylate cyclase
MELSEFALIGRSSTASLRIEKAGVSREHATIKKQGGNWVVQDLGSSNGTRVNRIPINSPTRLRNGDEIAFGPEIFIFRDGGAKVMANEGSDTATIISHRTPQLVQVTMLVGDLLGFSNVANSVPDSDLASSVSSWSDECRRIISNHNGHIDKFNGDCVFAWWMGCTDVTRRQALAAGMELAAGQRPVEGYPGLILRCGIGLHCGQAAVSRLGGENYTLLSQAVNLVFRIESLTRSLQVSVVASKAFVDGYRDASPRPRSLGPHQIKGWDEAVEVFAMEAENP